MRMIVQLVGPPAGGKHTFGAVLAAPPETSDILTNRLVDTPEDAAAAQVIRDLAVAPGATFHSVWLSCETAEIRRRLTLPDRAVRNKLLDTTPPDPGESADQIMAWLDAHH